MTHHPPRHIGSAQNPPLDSMAGRTFRGAVLAAALLLIAAGGLAACGPMAEPILPPQNGEQSAPDPAMDMEEASMDMSDSLSPSNEDQDESAGVERIDVQLTEFGITVPQTRFRTGQAYRFVIANTGALSHELRILPFGTSAEMLAMGDGGHMDMGEHQHGGELMLAAGTDLPAGGSYTIDHVFREPGQFELACHFAGHLEGGMLLPIEVEGVAMAITEDDIVVDTESMPDLSCHAMGTTIMGQCSEEDIARLKREILADAEAEAEHAMEHSDEPMDMDAAHDADADDHSHEDSSGDEDGEG